MELRYHGIHYNEDGSTGCLNLGILRLLQWLLVAFRMPRSTPDERRPEWPHKWFDRKFDRAVIKFQDTFNKFDRAAYHFGPCLEVVTHHREAERSNDADKFRADLEDIPLYLDLILIYLRIQADCLANVIPNLYGQQGRTASMPRDRFRQQVRWFIERRPDFDPEYAAILRSTLGWFDTLAGEGRGQGIRDVVVHRRGTYQLGFTVGNEPSQAEFHASLVNESGFVCNNIVPALKSMVAGYFTYLDHAFAHFAERLRAELGNEFTRAGEIATEYYHFDGPLPSFWVYPVVTTSKKQHPVT